MTHSADLQWQLVRRNSKFLQLRNGVRLSSDPFNNNARWTRRQAGFVSDKAVVVKAVNGKIVATIKSGAANMPKKSYSKKEFAADSKPSVVSKAIGAVRADLADTVFRRTARLQRVIKREVKVRAARKERSAKTSTNKRKTIRPKRK
jgi:large subunit ribosomal protein L28e